MSLVPDIRRRSLNERPVASDGKYVLYWMVAFRRPHWNFALQHAVNLAFELDKPLVILEALRIGYRWASDRLHGFVLDGMADNAAYFAGTPALHLPYVEKAADDGKGLLAALTAHACTVVTDDYPSFFLPRMQRVAAERASIRFEAIDSNGLLPIHATDKVFARAFDFRRFLQKNLIPHLDVPPLQTPLDGARIPPATEDLIPGILDRWPIASEEALRDPDLRALAIDHGVPRASFAGGFSAAEGRLQAFMNDAFDRYAAERNHPDAHAASGLSPWLHFGHLSSHQVFREVASSEGWSPDRVAAKVTGQREGWWGMGANAEAFLDELVTWREVGFNMSAHRDDYDRYESLPDWARTTLEAHQGDRREHVYDLERFAHSDTHDPIWNAAQTELRETGRMQNYLRMLWGKKILEWSRDPREALDVMVELNNKYAVDGRDPNSYSGIFWVLGRYDRAWGPERPIFGKIRYMSSDNTKRKLRMADYLAKFGEQSGLFT